MWLLACVPTTVPVAADPPATGSPPTGDSAAPEDTAPPEDSSPSEDTAPPQDSAPPEDTAVEPPPTCLESLASQQALPPDYARFAPVLNAACTGTDHQAIAGVEHVVFVGDSVTVGSPPSQVENLYRNVMAEELAVWFGIQAPEYEWYWYDLFTSHAAIQDSGDFSVCAKFGARTDDLKQDNTQISDCIPESRAAETTLVVMTVGGNDLFALVEDFHAGIAVDDLWTQVEDEVLRLREAVEWLKTDKARFPGTMFVVFANVFEFTDGMGNVDACPGAASLGYTYDLSAPDLQAMIQYYQEEFLHVAVDTGSDMVFLGEAFCGHGFNADEPSGPCYREDTQEVWFDLTCFHPNDAGHLAIAEAMLSVVE